jgi:micrococcal nuclease
MSKNRLVYSLIILTAAAVGYFSHHDLPRFTQQNNEHISTSTLYHVTTVADGDTIRIQLNGKEETLRLLGINTPEIDSKYRTAECWGQEASKETRSKLTGTSVRIESDPSQSLRDKYNRLLVYVFLPDGTNFNQQLVAEGFAREYTYAGSYKYQKEFKASEVKARTESRGLWSPDNCPQQ